MLLAFSWLAILAVSWLFDARATAEPCAAPPSVLLAAFPELLSLLEGTMATFVPPAFGDYCCIVYCLNSNVGMLRIVRRPCDRFGRACWRELAC